jgi:hypothetical protein
VSDNSVPEPQSPVSPVPDSPAKQEAGEASVGKNLAEELVDFLKGKSKNNNKTKGDDEAQSIYEFVQRGLGAATVYIDNRSGGIHVGRDARFAGDASGRDLTINTTVAANSSSAKGVAGQVLSVDIEKICSVYVQTDGYTQAKSILDEKHILIIRGDTHLGKWTTAIHLLSSRDSDGILEIDPIIEDLSSFECAAKQGYVIDALAPESAGKLRCSVLKSLSHKLRQHNSHLVITIDSRVQISQEDLGGYILNWSDLPGSAALIEKHLAWYLKTPEKLAGSHSLTQAKEVSELLDQKLLPGDVDRLAKLLAQVVSQELTLEEALSRFSLLVNQHVASWFDKHPDLNERTFMVALAVLSGSNYDAVQDASQRLLLIVKPPTEQDQPPNREAELNSKLSDRFKAVCAHLVKGYENAEYGSREVDLIEFDIPQFQPAVLSYVWKEYHNWRVPLLVWLHELGSDSNIEVRTRVAAAAGELSKYAFGLVLDEVLRPWANSEDLRQQQLAALALSILVFEGELASQVLKLLKHWSKLSNNLRLAWTVVAAYSGVGILFPGNALRDLLAIAQSGNTQLFFALVESIVSLFAAGQYPAVLQALQVWTEQESTTKAHQLGLVVFLGLMQQERVTTNSNGSQSPTLLWLAKENKIYEKLVTCLLRRALNLQATRTNALEAIHNWLNFVDYDRRLYPVLGRILYTLLTQGTQKERGRIVNYLKRWAVTEPPNAASKILSTINQHIDTYFRR